MQRRAKRYHRKVEQDWAWEYVVGSLADQFGIGRDGILPTDRLADLSFDSLDILEFVMTLEDEFGRDVPESELADIETVGDLVELVRELR